MPGLQSGVKSTLESQDGCWWGVLGRLLYLDDSLVLFVEVEAV